MKWLVGCKAMLSKLLPQHWPKYLSIHSLVQCFRYGLQIKAMLKYSITYTIKLLYSVFWQCLLHMTLKWKIHLHFTFATLLELNYQCKNVQKNVFFIQWGLNHHSISTSICAFSPPEHRNRHLAPAPSCVGIWMYI